MTIIAIDTETTGVDFHHGTKPFFCSVCYEDGRQLWWEWEIDPENRQPIIPQEDIRDITHLVLEEADELILQNAKFDVSAFKTICPELADNWPWHKTQDTLIAGHLLASNQPHDLTSMGIQYLGVDIERLELELGRATNKARAFVRNRLKGEGWAIANDSNPRTPSAGGNKVWKYDTWLPKAVVRKQWEESKSFEAYQQGKSNFHKMPGWDFHPPDVFAPNGVATTPPHAWWTVLSSYANADTAVTLGVWQQQRHQIAERDLKEIYQERMKALPVAYKMEQRGITVSNERLQYLTTEYRAASEESGAVCKGIASGLGYELELPKSGNNASVVNFAFDHLKLPPLKRSAKTGKPSLDKHVLEAYETILPPNSRQLLFIRSLKSKRKRDTALQYMQGYQRFWRPFNTEDYRDWFVLHPNLNPTGTDTLRWSCNNPNEQNISKQEGFNLRYCFGPAPGREWWSLDAKNIELRIPAYEAGEELMIELFEQPDKPPYYGSNHLLNFHTVYPDIWEAVEREVGFEKVGPTCKKRYASSWYQYCKNGGFAVQYGALERADGSGTADRAFHRPGSHAKLKRRFGKMEALNRSCIAQAEELGYVETMPDKTVNPNKGYPLMCTRTENGGILPTVPLNYHVQGTAMWWMLKAMNRCQAQLDSWRESTGFDGYLIMQVHDELVFDFPKSRLHPKEEADLWKSHKGGARFYRSNLWRARKIQKIMEQGGDDIGIPTPVSCEYHEVSWSEGVSV